MNLLTLVNALLTLNIRMSVQKADALYKSLGLERMASDLEYYRAECERLTDQLRAYQDQDLARLREKLTGQSTHDYLVQMALGSETIIDLVANGRKIQAIKELRIAAQCGLREAKDAIEDHRVKDRAALSELERDLPF